MDVSAILSEFDDHGFVDTTTTRKMAALNETYHDVCGREPWPFLEKSVALTFTGSSDSAGNAPTDLRAVLKCYRTGTGFYLRPQRLDDIIENYSASLGTLVDDPSYYYFEGLTQKFFPRPRSSSSVTMKYLRIPVDLGSTDLEAVIALPARYHRGVLVNGTLEKLYAMEDDTDLAAWFERKFEKAMDRMRQDLWKLQWDEPEYIHQVDPEDYVDL